jgi:dTDP-4-amino-4,6-dideoxygalactose transaminase
VVYAHRQHARSYTDALKDAPGVTVPPWDAGCSYWLYCLLLESEAARDDLIRHLAERGIAASPVHARNDKHTGFGGTGDASDLRGVRPGVDAFSERECAIPVGWWLTEKDLAHVIAAVTAWAERTAEAEPKEVSRA